MVDHKRVQRKTKKIPEASGGLVFVGGINKTTSQIMVSEGRKHPITLHITDADIARWGRGEEHTEEEAEEAPQVNSRDLIFKKGKFHQRTSRLMVEGEEWPKGGVGSCFWCGCQCPQDRPPIGIPEQWFESEDKFVLYAPMCSIKCAVSWFLNGGDADIDQCSIETLANRQQLFSLMLNRVGLDITEFKPQQSKYLHKRYGGILEDSDYWDGSDASFKYEIFTTIVRPVPYWVEETGIKMRTHRG
jgi:hypothetical protein